MDTSQVVILTVFLTIVGISLGWFVIWLFTNVVESKHNATKDAAVRAVFKNWQWHEQERRLDALSKEVFDLHMKVDPPKKRVAK